MADYRELINGAINKIRETAEGKSLQELIDSGVQRAESFGEAAKTAMSLSSDKAELQRTFAEIGKLFYEQNRLTAPEYYAELFENASKLEQLIAEKEEAVINYKNGAFAPGEPEEDPDIEVEIIEFGQSAEGEDSEQP